MSERYPDEYWLVDFERRLRDDRLLTREESLGLSDDGLAPWCRALDG